MTTQEDIRKNIQTAVDSKDFVLLKNILESSSSPPIYICSDYAARKGYLDVLQWTVENGFNLDCMTWYNAIKTGQLHVLEWLKQFTDQFGFNTNETCADAIGNKQWKVVEWARKNNYGWGNLSCCFAASNGDLDILKRARSEGAHWDEQTCMYAARKGHVHILKWLRSQDSPDGKDSYNCLDGKDSYNCLDGKDSYGRPDGKDSYGRPCPWDDTTCRTAAAHGHLDVLKWAVANGCPWNPYAFSDAGFNGHMHIVQWILYMKLPWDIESKVDYNHHTRHATHNTYNSYNSYLWYTKYSNKARWVEAIDVNLAECLHCMDLEQLIKTYI